MTAIVLLLSAVVLRDRKRHATKQQVVHPANELFSVCVPGELPELRAYPVKDGSWTSPRLWNELLQARLQGLRRPGKPTTCRSSKAFCVCHYERVE